MISNPKYFSDVILGILCSDNTKGDFLYSLQVYHNWPRGFHTYRCRTCEKKGSKTRFHAAFPISNPNQIEPAFLLVTIHKAIVFMTSIRYNEGWFENVVKI